MKTELMLLITKLKISITHGKKNSRGEISCGESSRGEITSGEFFPLRSYLEPVSLDTLGLLITVDTLLLLLKFSTGLD